MEVNWRKVDLHLHSDASFDCTLSAEALVDEIIKCGINLFSVTDHNCIDNISKIREIVEKKKEQGTEIEFLPGIEIRTDKGGHAIHILSIFPENITEAILRDKFLPALSLTRTDIITKGKEGQPRSINDDDAYQIGLKKKYANFEMVVNATKELGGLIIGAHPKSNNGVEEELDYTNTQNELICDLVKSINIMEVRRNKATQDRDFYLNKNKNFIKEMASIKNSDAHFIVANPDDKDDPRVVGKHYSWIKMDTINFDGLIQILFEPELRICITDEKPAINHPYIKELSVTGGYYKECPITFSPELNTIIGGRGSGKSVVIDLIKFVFGKYEVSDIEFMDRLYNLLRPTNTVTLELFDERGQSRTISRTLDLTKQNEKVYVDTSAPIESPLDVELFGQGKLKIITKKVDEKLRLIDEIGGTQRILENIKTKTEELEENASKQIQSITEIASDIDKVSNKATIQRSIHEIELLLNEPILQDFQHFEEQKKYFDLILKNLSNIVSLKERFDRESSNYLRIEFPDTTDPVLAQLKSESERVFMEIGALEKAATEKMQQLISEINTIKINDEIWLDKYHEKAEEYSSYLKDHGMENILDETKKLKINKDQLIEIENNVNADLKMHVFGG